MKVLRIALSLLLASVLLGLPPLPASAEEAAILSVEDRRPEVLVTLSGAQEGYLIVAFYNDFHNDREDPVLVGGRLRDCGIARIKQGQTKATVKVRLGAIKSVQLQVFLLDLDYRPQAASYRSWGR